MLIAGPYYYAPPSMTDRPGTRVRLAVAFVTTGMPKICAKLPSRRQQPLENCTQTPFRTTCIPISVTHYDYFGRLGLDFDVHAK